jgi:putative ABC transport system permease protein
LGHFRQDLAHALRRLGRRKGFALVAAATLALGIGGSVAIFSVAHAVVLRPLPYADPERLVLAWQRDLERGQAFVEMSYPSYRHWREANAVFDDLAGLPSTNQSWTLSGRGEPVALVGRLVTSSFFPVMGVAPALGRVLMPEDDRRGAARVVVLGHACWRDRFGADPAVVGRPIVLDREPFTVVGVMPEGFAYPEGALLWSPLVPGVSELAEQPGVWWMSAIGRLKPEVSLDEARREMAGLAERYNLEAYKVKGVTAVLTPLAEGVFGPTRPALLALLGGTGLVLLVACANVAALQIVQLSERASEMALRAALGASRAHIARGLLAESLVLGLVGGLLGVAGATAFVPLLVAIAPGDVPRLADAALDREALLVAVTLTLLTALATALGPILAFERRSLREALAGGSRVTPGGSRLRAGLVAAEVGLALVVLVGAGLLLRSFAALRDVPLGYDAARVLAVEAGPPEDRYPEPERQRQYVDALVARLRALPGVESAAAVTLRPLWGTVGMDWPFTLEGQSPKDAERNPLLNFETVTPDYFRTMGIPVKRGRAFDERDRDGQPGVVVVSEALARRDWPGQDPIGKRLKLPLPPTRYHDAWLTVVGVAGDARYRELQATRFDLYMSYQQSNHPTHHLVLRLRGEPSRLAAAIVREVRAHDAEAAAPLLVPLTEAVGRALAVPRFAARVFSGFGLVALMLAGLGLYGLVAHSVGRRTREIGLRVTLGAQPAHIVRLVLREGVAPALVGATLGSLAAIAAGPLLSRLLFGVSPGDGVTFAAAAALLVAVSLLAAALPARRALAVEPAAALRQE